MHFRRLIKAGVCALAMLAAAPGVAQADPISASIVAAIGLSGVAATVATTAITLALTIGANFAVNALFPPKAPPGGAVLQVQTGGALPRSVAFGQVASAGSLVYWNTYGKKNKFLQLVYRLCDWDCDSLQAIWIDGKKITLNSVSVPGGNNEAARYEVDGYGNKFVVRWFDGSALQLADTELVANASPSGRWTTDHRLRGVCYVSLTLTFDDNLFAGGLPQMLFEFRGAKVYDRRLDTTAGGSGSQRWNNPATWAYSANPAVCAETFLRGFYRSGTRIHGWGLPEAALDTGDIVAMANLCDEALTEGSSSVVRYTCSVYSSEDNELRQALTAFVEAAGGYYYEAGGIIHLVGGGAQSVVATLTLDDRVIDAPYAYDEKASRASLVNRISGTFTDPASGWQQLDYPEISDAAWISEDNGEDLGLSYNLPSVTSGYQAERIARIRAEIGRLQGRLKITVTEKHIDKGPGDWIGYADAKTGPDRTWLIAGLQENADQGTITLDLEEVSADAFGDAVLFDPVAPVDPTPDPGATTIAGLAATGVKLDQGNGEVAAIQLTWTPPDDDTITGVRFEYNIDAAGAVVQQVQMANPESGEFYITDGLAQDTDYLVRATIITDPVRAVTWTDYEAATTPVITPPAPQISKRRTYIADGVWTKAANPATNAIDAFVIIEAWGGGGGGGRGTQGAGGGGGCYVRTEIAYSDLPASLDITVGAGGLGRTGSTGHGLPGESSVVSETGGSTVYVTAFPGGGGEGRGNASDTVLGGGGGGLLGAGQNGQDGGAGGELGGGENLTEGNVTPPTEAGGGGAGNSNIGGNAFYGGAGGGAGGSSVGGESKFGGNGGDGGSGASASTAGGVRGGGGGGGDLGANGSDGGRGEVRITVVG